MSWHDAVKSLRLAQQLTQEELARRAGLSQGTIANFEKGRHENPTEQMQQRLARGFGISVAALRQAAGGDDPPDLTGLPAGLVRQILDLDAESRAKALDYLRLLQGAQQERQRRGPKVGRQAQPDQAEADPPQGGQASAAGLRGRVQV